MQSPAGQSHGWFRRGNEGKPVTLVISVDGKPVKSEQVETSFTLVNRQGGATQRTYAEVRMYLPQGAHKLRAEFVGDEIVKGLPAQAQMNPGRNVFAETFEIAGPFPSTEQSAARKQLLVCDPALGVTCVTRILNPLVRRAYRRPTQPMEIAKLLVVQTKALKAGYTPGQSLQFAIAAMLVSPQFLFRVERNPLAGIFAKVTDLELATRV